MASTESIEQKRYGVTFGKGRDFCRCGMKLVGHERQIGVCTDCVTRSQHGPATRVKKLNPGYGWTKRGTDG